MSGRLETVPQRWSCLSMLNQGHDKNNIPDREEQQVKRHKGIKVGSLFKEKQLPSTMEGYMVWMEKS